MRTRTGLFVLICLLASGVMAGMGATSRAATATVVPVVVGPVLQGFVTGGSADGSYALDDVSNGTLDVYGSDGTTLLSEPSRDNSNGGTAYLDDVLADWSSRPAKVYPVGGTAWSLSTTDRILTLAGTAGLLLQASDDSLVLATPDGSLTTLGNPGEELTSASADSEGGLGLGSDGQVFSVDVSAPSVTAVSGASDGTAVYERGTERAYLNTAGQVVRLAADATTSSSVQVPDTPALGNPYGVTDTLYSLVVTANATYVRGADLLYSGPAAGPLQALGIGPVSGVAAVAGDSALTATASGDSTVYEIGPDTSPGPTVELEQAAGAASGRLLNVAAQTDEQDINPVLRVFDPSNAGDPSLAQTQLTAGTHTIALQATAGTGVGPVVTTTVDVVAHPAEIVLGTNREIYELADGATTAWGGVGYSTPSMAAVGAVDYAAVEGARGVVYLRDAQVGWTPVTSNQVCDDPAIAPVETSTGSIYLGCTNAQHQLIITTLAVSPTRLGSRLGAGGTANPSSFDNIGGTVVGAPVLFADGGGAVLGTEGRVYYFTGSSFEYLRQLSCAGPLGGGSALLGGVSQPLLGCEQKDGSLFLDDRNGISLGGVISGEPSFAVQSDGSALVTVIGTHNRLYQQSFDGTTGHGWRAITGAGLLGLTGTWTDGS